MKFRFIVILCLVLLCLSCSERISFDVFLSDMIRVSEFYTSNDFLYDDDGATFVYLTARVIDHNQSNLEGQEVIFKSNVPEIRFLAVSEEYLGFISDNAGLVKAIVWVAGFVLTENELERIAIIEVFIGSELKSTINVIIKRNKEGKVIIAQAFTQLTCQSCPNSEAVLNDILQDNPNNFIVLKYHVNDSLATYSQPTIEFSYYGLQVMPTVIFDGRNKIVGASDTALNSYQAIADNMLAEEPELFLEIEFYEVLGQTVSGSVNISFDNNLDLDNLYLYYLVYEEETEALNHANQKATKVVRERKRMILENLENNSVHNFSLESSYFHDTDLYLVVWVQRIVNTSSQNTETDKIYNAVKQRLY